MQIFTQKIAILLISFHLFPFCLQGKNLIINAIKSNATNLNSTTAYGPFLNRVRDPRYAGCRRRPWICNQDADFPRIQRRCCWNRCVDVSSDVNNCGLCGIRCLFGRQCCRGLCVNTNRNPFNCGKCDHRCPFPSLCFFGMCGYAQPLPPFPFPPRPPRPPFPFPPRPPRPPFPFPPRPPRPPFPFPPRPPFPFPPRPPFPFPPKPYPPRKLWSPKGGGRGDHPPPVE